MTNASIPADWLEFNNETVNALLADGSHPEKPHTLEFHIAGKAFPALEKAAVDLFKAEFEVTDAEELVLDDGSVIFSFDAIREMALDVEKINQHTSTILAVCAKHDLFYDGWGTYFVE